MNSLPALLLLQAVFLLLVGFCSPGALAANASGRFSPHCDGASFYLSKVDGLPIGQTLVLNIRQFNMSWWTYRPQEVWTDVYAARCSPARKCEVASHARVWLNKVGPKDKHASGKYEVEFGGQHLAGEFSVKYHNDKTWICE
jgi:hypothetical protein